MKRFWEIQLTSLFYFILVSNNFSKFVIKSSGVYIYIKIKLTIKSSKIKSFSILSDSYSIFHLASIFLKGKLLRAPYSYI